MAEAPVTIKHLLTAMMIGLSIIRTLTTQYLVLTTRQKVRKYKHTTWSYYLTHKCVYKLKKNVSKQDWALGFVMKLVGKIFMHTYSSFVIF